MLLRISADWNEPRERTEPSTVQAHWHFPHGLPVTQPAWRKQAGRYARKLLELSQTAGQGTVLHDPLPCTLRACASCWPTTTTQPHRPGSTRPAPQQRLPAVRQHAQQLLSK